MSVRRPDSQTVMVDTIEVLSPRQKRMAVFSLSSCTLLIALETTMTAIISPAIRDQLGGSVSTVFAISTIYLLGAATCQPVWAEISHAMGRKPILLTGLIIYCIGSILAATCGNLTVLFTARVLQGIGGAAITALPSMVLADMFPLVQRTLWQQVLNLLWAIGSIIGPILGGLILSGGKEHWRNALWLEFGLAILSIVAVGFGLDSKWPRGRALKALGSIDWVGILLTIPTVLLLFFPLTCGGGFIAWNTWPIIASLVVGVFCFVPLLTCHQRCWRKNPMFRRELFGNRALVTGFIGALVSGSLLWMLLYVRQLPSLQVAILVLPETLTFVPTLLVSALLIKHTKRYRWANILGWTMTTLGFGLLQLMKRIQLDVETAFINIVLGIGLGILFAGLVPTIQAAVDPGFKAHATSMTILMRSGGQALGVAIGGTIFICRLKPAVDQLKLGDAYQLVDSLTQEGNDSVSWSGATRKAILGHIELSIRPIWVYGCVLAGIMTIAVATLQVGPLSDNAANQPDEATGNGDVKGDDGKSTTSAQVHTICV